jgi:hypothetical protein
LAGRHAGLACLSDHHERQSGERIERGEVTQDPGPHRQAQAKAEQRDRGRGRRRILFKRPDQPQQHDDHGDRERRVLGVDEHVAVVERAGREKQQSQQAGERASKSASDPPGDRKPDQPDRGAAQPARLEQIERQNLGGERGQHVEPAAVGVQIDERERAPVAKSGLVKS